MLWRGRIGVLISDVGFSVDEASICQRPAALSQTGGSVLRRDSTEGAALRRRHDAIHDKPDRGEARLVVSALDQ